MPKYSSDRPQRSMSFSVWAGIIAGTFLTLLTLMIFVLSSADAVDRPRSKPLTAPPALAIVPSPVLPRDPAYFPLTGDGNGFYRYEPRDVILAQPR